RWRSAVMRQDPVRNMVMATRQPMLFEDAQSDERIPESGRNFFTRTLIRSAGVLPLHAKDEVLGVLQVASLRPLAFNRQGRDLVEGIAGQIATAIKGIKLYEDRRIAEEELRHAQDLLTATIESTADGILVVNSEGAVVYNNARFADIWGLDDDV